MVKCKECHYGWTDWVKTEDGDTISVTVCKYGLMHDRGPDALVDPWVSRSCPTYKKKYRSG